MVEFIVFATLVWVCILPIALIHQAVVNHKRKRK